MITEHLKQIITIKRDFTVLRTWNVFFLILYYTSLHFAHYYIYIHIYIYAYNILLFVSIRRHIPV